MNRSRLRGAVRAASPAFFTALAVLGVYWVLLGHPGWFDWCSLTLYREMWFGDTWVLLAASDLRAAGFDPYGPNPLGIVHVYPRVWFGLHDLGLDRGDALWFGTLIGLLFLGASLWWVRPRTWSEAVVAIGFLISPAFVLGFNRGNNDLIILLLMMGLCCFLVADSPRIRFMGPVVVLIGAILKFYPVLAGFALVFGRGHRRERLWQGLFFAGLCLVLATPLREDYAMAIKGVPQKPGFYGFGAVLSPFSALGGLAWTGLLAAAFFGWRTGGGAVDDSTSALDRAGFVVGAILTVGCFCAGVSYLYRLVVIVLILPWLWRCVRIGAKRFWARAAIWVGLAVVWLDCILILATVASLLRHETRWAEIIQAASGGWRLSLQWLWVGALVYLLAGLCRDLWNREWEMRA